MPLDADGKAQQPAEQLTEDHRLTNPDERERLAKMGIALGALPLCRVIARLRISGRIETVIMSFQAPDPYSISARLVGLYADGSVEGYHLRH